MFNFLHLPESQRLQQDLQKVQQLEGKITDELSTLKEQVSTMESKLHTYRDLDTLKRTAEEKRKVTQSLLETFIPDDSKVYLKLYYFLVQRLLEDQVSLSQRRDSFGQLLEEMNKKYEALQTKLKENETHAQVRAFYNLII